MGILPFQKIVPITLKKKYNPLSSCISNWIIKHDTGDMTSEFFFSIIKNQSYFIAQNIGLKNYPVILVPKFKKAENFRL